ncbi:MocR-like pyridoxine biosynthesis transcription factor PdxR [Achromobacter marplatensis]|uniref:GntR family transcriptional regulator/MocR family aminotransferase n=1 Tax=Achromobacter marplatensis TaxID=470868 RepID=A0ABX9GID4_9BURK|nr:PLP-dependent aminotransferase family protein [Achromobacter marplatensis]RBP24288.1 GntR family transcriptional regulator/MocR family aminotransferase [Achromobacter marplatensis]CAB3627334.1 HTH-type transcriptional regulatory protein GabR [Achromobacter marplatensis]
MIDRRPKDGLPPLVPNSADPLYRQVYERFRGAITQGTLAPGDRIPSARALAKEMGVARGTIEVAYSLLVAEGYIQTRGQAGTIVTPDLQPQAPPAAVAPPPETPDDEHGWHRPSVILPFQMGVPALDEFPRKLWARLGARQLRSLQAPELSYPPSNGLMGLRTAVAAYLQVARGIHCQPSQVFITSGYNHTMQLVMQALLAPGDRVWVEDPGYPPTRALLAQARLQAVPIPVDQDGLMVGEGVARCLDAKAAVVTPAHQSPLSMSLSLPRRQALLEWAERQQAWIVEDDYDGEYRYVSRPLPALKSLDAQGRVLYAGSFSKVLFPGMRLAYLVVPPAQVGAFDRICRLLSGTAPGLTQSILTAFIAEGHFGRHIQRMRRLYSERRNATAAGLTAALGDRMHIEPQPGGMHLVARMQGQLTDVPLAARMLEQGMYAHPLSRWSTLPDPQSGLLLSFTNIASETQALELGLRIKALM